MSTLDRALGAFYGLAVGDALGMPTQTLPRRLVSDLYGELPWFEPGPDLNEVSRGMPAGHVTDDTDQAVLLAQTLVDGDGVLDPLLFAERLLEWKSRMIAAGSADLLGPSTQLALDAVAAGVPPDEAGRRGDTNGAAMRVTPIGIATPPEPLDRLCAAVAAASRVTHGTGVAIAGACAVAAAVSCGIDGAGLDDALTTGVAAAELGSRLGAGSGAADAADVPGRIVRAVEQVRDHDPDVALDVVDRVVGTSVATEESVPAAFAVATLAPDDPWLVCRLAARIGGDSDTIAAMAGAMVGACCGLRSFPPDAVATVRDVNALDLEPLVRALLVLRGRQRG